MPPSWTTVPDVDDGASFSGTHTNAYRDGIMQLQTALNPIRRRDARNTTTYAVGTQDLVPNSTTENEGGITTLAGLITVPQSTLYSLSIAFNPTAAPGTDDFIQLVITRGVDTYMSDRRSLQDVATGTIVGWNTYMFAGDTAKFQLVVVTASIQCTWETTVAAVMPVTP